MLIDTHCHLDTFAAFKSHSEGSGKNRPLSVNPEQRRRTDFPASEADLDSVIQRAKEAGVAYFINIGATLGSSAAACVLAQKYPEVYATVGVHPHDADTFDSQAFDKLKKLAAAEKVVAIGETGLDYYRNLSGKENQRQAFLKQIALAKELDLPVVVHCREAQEEVLQILKESQPVRAVVHCFAGEEGFLRACLNYGFFISYTCNITYKKAQMLREMVKLTPLDRLMLETDAPYLSPEGSRGKRNEPAQIKLLAEQVGQIKGVSLAEIEDCTTRNAKGFFKLPWALKFQ